MDKKNKFIISLFLVALMSSSLWLVTNVAAEEVDYENISIQTAKHMIKHNPDIVILDVRNQSEYDLGHLYNAVLMPYYVIENKTMPLSAPSTNNSLLIKAYEYAAAHDFNLSAHKNDAIIVYCSAGLRSPIAAQILVNLGFSTVYNMYEGINGWLDAGYKIFTPYHHVSIDVIDNKTTVAIEPWIQYVNHCTPCQNLNQTCLGNSLPTYTNDTTIIQNETTTLITTNVEINGTLQEYVIEKSLLWQSNESYTDFNRSISLHSYSVTTLNTTSQGFSLSDIVEHADYEISINTMLTGADATTYNQSSTTMQYIPKGPKSIITQESIVFNTSTTFSELYQSLSKATHKLGKVYEKSVDDQLTIFAERYYTMAEEVKNLSRVIKTQLPSYDKTILFSDAAIEDGVWSDYCTIFCPILGAALCASCIAGFAPGCVLCVTYATQLSMGCAMGCLAIQYLEEQGGQPSAKYYAQYLTAATWYPTDSPTAHVWNGNNLLEPYSDHQFAQIYAGNYQEQAAVVVQLNNWAGGDIWITGFSYQGYFTSYQVWVSDDNSDWGQNPLYSSTLPYSMWPNPPNVNHDFYGGNSGYDTFRYIAIVCYDSGNSCNLMVDCISVNS